jgi:signal transduction histidine kinase
LRVLVEEIRAELDANATARRVELCSKLEVHTLSADADLLRRVLVNLVENALRYSPPSTKVTISASAIGDDVELRIADQGKGIPEAMRERVFQPFVQVESGERVAERTSRGLGLSFCRLAVEAHGGKIWVEDASPGCAFCIRLPPTTSGPPSVAS